MSSGKTHITGIHEGTGPGGKVPFRRNLVDVAQDKIYLNLYLLGLKRMQEIPQKDFLSYYQIAGIHGQPYTPWEDETAGTGKKGGDYCTHSSILFLPWHRPYLVLFEQTLWKCAKEVVQSFPLGDFRSQLEKVLPTFRAPYWDWAANSELPGILAKEQVKVITAKGPVVIRNPLFSYRFNPATPDAFSGIFKEWDETLRWPTSTQDPNATSQTDLFQSSIVQDLNDPSATDPVTGVALNVRDRIFQLLSIDGSQKYAVFQDFSNNRFRDGPSARKYDDLESVHGSIHVWTGEGGHMNFPENAGFDPIFWLHHCNIDRLYALWQALHPEAANWHGDESSAGTTEQWWVQAVSPGGRENQNTPLIPFHKDDNTYWTGTTVLNFPTAFGYNYPETANWGSISPAELKQQVTLAVKALYGNTAPMGKIMKATKGVPDLVPNDTEPVKIAGVPVAPQAVLHTPAPKLGNILKHEEYREYIAAIRAPKYMLGEPYSVLVFLDQPVDENRANRLDPNIVGIWDNFANNLASTGCQNCKRQAEQNIIISGGIPLTGALLDRIKQGLLQSLEPVHVIPYLKKKLQWRVHRQDENKSNVHRRDCPGLKFGVASVVVEVPTQPGALPTYKEERFEPECTAEKPSGLTAHDSL